MTWPKSNEEREIATNGYRNNWSARKHWPLHRYRHPIISSPN